MHHRQHRPLVALFCLAALASAAALSGCNRKTGQLRSEALGSIEAAAVHDDFDVGGTYRFEAIRTSVARAPFVGEIKNQLAYEGYLTLSQNDDGTVRMEREVCHAELLSAKEAVRSTIRERFLRELYSGSYDGRLWIDGGVAHLEFREVRYVSGADLEDPGHDPLPESADDERVVDSDTDGKPGITIHVEGIATGQIYMVQRITSTWRSTAVSEEGIEGQIEWSEERSILGATADRLEQKRDSRVTDDPSENRFVMQRVEDGASCADHDDSDVSDVDDADDPDLEIYDEPQVAPIGIETPSVGEPTEGPNGIPAEERQ